MAEEGTLGLARAHDTVDDTSKEDLQRRMDEARESISQTVTEIKDTVVHQYESVKESISETLDWREQFKKRPVAWAAGAVGAGFLTGYCLTAMVKGESNGHDRYYQEDYQPARRAYSAQPIVGQSAFAAGEQDEDTGPGLIERIQDTQMYDRVKNEASVIGDQLVNEVSKTAKDILVPAAVSLVRNWLEGLLPKTATASHK
ncbi:MAG: hypothetical protein JWM21_4991 [Acidobacteria bacterium]|nr:hypothetical protein [Acidobacteriota bacterium]